MNRMVIVLASMLCLAALGCDNYSATGPFPESRRMGDIRVISESVFGNEEAETAVLDLARDQGGSLFYRGVLNGDSTLGRLAEGGIPDWTVREQSFCLASVPLTSEALIVSAPAQELAVYSAGGALRSRLRLDESIGSIRLHDVAITSLRADTASLVVVGGVATGSGSYPFAASIGLSAGGALTVIADTVLIDAPGSRFTLVAADTSVAPTRCYVVHNFFSGSGGFLHSSVLAMSGALEVGWSSDLSDIRGTSELASDICWCGDGIAVVGRSLVKKDGDEEWASVFARFLDRSGSVRWTQSIDLTKFDDAYYGCALAGNEILAAGIASAFYQLNTTRAYGYGLLSRIDVATGAFKGHMMPGNPDYHSGLNAIAFADNVAICAGFTKQYILEGGRRGWVLALDVGASEGGEGLEVAPPAPACVLPKCQIDVRLPLEAR